MHCSCSQCFHFVFHSLSTGHAGLQTGKALQMDITFFVVFCISSSKKCPFSSSHSLVIAECSFNCWVYSTNNVVRWLWIVCKGTKHNLFKSFVAFTYRDKLEYKCLSNHERVNIKLKWYDYAMRKRILYLCLYCDNSTPFSFSDHKTSPLSFIGVKHFCCLF